MLGDAASQPAPLFLCSSFDLRLPVPIDSIVVPLWGYFLGSLILKWVHPKKGTTTETISMENPGFRVVAEMSYTFDVCMPPDPSRIVRRDGVRLRALQTHADTAYQTQS